MVFVYKLYRKIKIVVLRFNSRILSKVIESDIRKSGGKVGVNFSVGNDVVISGLSNVVIGNNVSIGSGCFIRGDGGLFIGDNVVISRNAVIYTSSHDYKGDGIPYSGDYIYSPVHIGDNVWIGMNVTISPGATLGDGSIVALGTRVYGRVDRLAIVGSPSIKRIGSRDLEKYEKFKK